MRQQILRPISAEELTFPVDSMTVVKAPGDIRQHLTRVICGCTFSARVGEGGRIPRPLDERLGEAAIPSGAKDAARRLSNEMHFGRKHAGFGGRL